MDGENKGSKPYEQMDDLGVLKSPYSWVQHPNGFGIVVSPVYFPPPPPPTNRFH